MTDFENVQNFQAVGYHDYGIRRKTLRNISTTTKRRKATKDSEIIIFQFLTSYYYR